MRLSNPRDDFLGNNQDMARCLGGDVPECNRDVVFMDNVGRNLARDDPFKQCSLGHLYQSGEPGSYREEVQLLQDEPDITLPEMNHFTRDEFVDFNRQFFTGIVPAGCTAKVFYRFAQAEAEDL